MNENANFPVSWFSGGKTVPETVSGETTADIGTFCSSFDDSSDLGLCTPINR